MIGGKNDFRSLKEKYTLFSWSQPVGYDFSEVEQVIDEYRETISDMNELLIKKEEENDLLRAKLDDYTKEIVEMRMNMEAMTIPVYPQQQSIEILDNFKDSETVVVDAPQHQQEQHHQPAQQQRQQSVNTKKQDLINRQQQSSNQNQYNQTNAGYGQPQQNQQIRTDRRVEQDTRKRLIVDDGDDFYTSSAGTSDIII